MAETNLEKFKRLLRELFMFDQADLDFGIYRIMNSKRDEITSFLENDLLPQVQRALGELEAGDHTALQADLAKAIEQAKALGVDPETAQKVKDLRQKLAQKADLEAIENEIFSSLYSFFRRYYSEGDFLSLRRYKEGVYAIPYEGEEVKLYWANADQYYIKTAEYFRDYTFKLADGRRVHFKLVAADILPNNNGQSANQERQFLLHEPDPIGEEDGDLIIRFEYRADEKKRKQADLNAESSQNILNSERSREWIHELAAPAPTGKNHDRTVLGKHLADYTARNTFDYFIHKNLGAFLRRELDFFIKNEVMHLDDVESETATRVEQYLTRIKALREIAHKLIDFLAQLENFQRKLWLKRKFVINTAYCVKLDHVPRELYGQIAANDAQRKEWVRVLGINTLEQDLTTTPYTEPLSVAFLESHSSLMVDTRFFDGAFVNALMTSIDDLDEAVDGVLVHGENFQALAILRPRYQKQIQCIYADPPYNTDAGPIAYKNGYRSSSWVSLMENRLTPAKEFLTEIGIICVTVDDYQVHELAMLLDGIFGRPNQLGVAVTRSYLINTCKALRA